MHLVPIAAIFSVSARDCQALFGSRIRRKIDCKLNGPFFFLKLFCSNCVASECHTRGALASHARVSPVSPTSCPFSVSLRAFCLPVHAYFNTKKYGLFAVQAQASCS